jgi:hypothetical protein
VLQGLPTEFHSFLIFTQFFQGNSSPVVSFAILFVKLNHLIDQLNALTPLFLALVDHGDVQIYRDLSFHQLVHRLVLLQILWNELFDFPQSLIVVVHSLVEVPILELLVTNTLEIVDDLKVIVYFFWLF